MGLSCSAVGRKAQNTVVEASIRFRAPVGLADEALHAFTIRHDIGRQDLQRHVPIEVRTLGQIYFAHPAGTERGGDPVVFERAVDHEARGPQRL